MSMHPRALAEVPEQTAAAFPKGALAMRIRDELGEVFADGAFINAFGIRGKPGISPGQLAMVTVLGVRGEPHRSAGRRRGAGTDRLEILFRPGADGSGFRFHRAVTVPNPAGRSRSAEQGL